MILLEDKDLADLDRQISTDGFISFYQALCEINKIDQADISVNEYNYPKLVPSAFTYHRKKDNTGKFIDDGKCRVCDKDRQYLIVRPGVVPMCYRCYQAVRGYSNLLFDPLHLKKKRDLTVADCKKAVKYMNTYAKKKLVALGALGAMLAIDYVDKKKK